jgi:hypothetical protein
LFIWLPEQNSKLTVIVESEQPPVWGSRHLEDEACQLLAVMQLFGQYCLTALLTDFLAGGMYEIWCE